MPKKGVLFCLICVSIEYNIHTKDKTSWYFGKIEFIQDSGLFLVPLLTVEETHFLSIVELPSKQNQLIFVRMR